MCDPIWQLGDGETLRNSEMGFPWRAIPFNHFKESCRYWIRVRLFVRTTGEDLGYFRFSSRPESREVWKWSWGECGETGV